MEFSPRRFAVFLIAAFLAVGASARSYCFGVQVVGAGKPVILIPGLTCGGNVWDGTVAMLKSKYQCHVLTLPGFAGQAPIEGPILSHVRDDILAYVKDMHLDHPALIGHSLGGTLALELAEADPGLWGPIVSIDGLPFLALTYFPNVTAESIKPFAESTASKLAAATPGAFKARIRASLAGGMIDSKQADALYVTCSQSDQATAAEAMKEVLMTDLRPQLSTIQSPVLLIGAGRQANGAAQQKLLRETYEKQIKPIPHAKLIMDWRALHFVMLDDPQTFVSDVEGFLGS